MAFFELTPEMFLLDLGAGPRYRLPLDIVPGLDIRQSGKCDLDFRSEVGGVCLIRPTDCFCFGNHSSLPVRAHGGAPMRCSKRRVWTPPTGRRPLSRGRSWATPLSRLVARRYWPLK